MKKIHEMCMTDSEIDIFRHVLVPKARIMKKEEVEELLKKYHTTKLHLPKILSKDPMCKALDAKVGDVLEIKRKSPTAGESVYYRVVVTE